MTGYDSGVLGRTRAYSGVLGRTRAYSGDSGVLGLQSRNAAAMNNCALREPLISHLVEGLRFIGSIGFIGFIGFIGLIGFIGFIGLIGFIGFIGFIRFIRFIGFIGFIRFNLNKPPESASLPLRCSRRQPCQGIR